MLLYPECSEVSEVSREDELMAGSKFPTPAQYDATITNLRKAIIAASKRDSNVLRARTRDQLRACGGTWKGTVAQVRTALREARSEMYHSDQGTIYGK